ncbi:MAG: hypothetical protein HY806_06845 [Nitrospirae bacterium]|nr:hypothetical protein [Nitrospirota bacterium]MBI4838848.1 hypothetical protein [Nitrospirota bacterium]
MKKIYFLLIIIFLTAYGCGGNDKVKPSADSQTAQEVIRITNAIKTAYEQKDIDALREYLFPEFADEIKKELLFENAGLEFTTRMVRITDSSVMVTLNWQGTWEIKGKTQKNLGSSVFIYQVMTMKLAAIDGDNPFLIPVVRN